MASWLKLNWTRSSPRRSAAGVQSRRDVLSAVFTRAIDRGELPAGLDVGHAVDLVFGPFWYRLLVEHLPVDPTEVPAHVHRLLHGLSDATPRS